MPNEMGIWEQRIDSLDKSRSSRRLCRCPSSSVCCLATANFTGPVVSVLDGDTIEVLHNTKPERVRLSGIDCSEKGQAYGNNAELATSALVFGKQVMLQTFAKDKYKRLMPSL